MKKLILVLCALGIPVAVLAATTSPWTPPNTPPTTQASGAPGNFTVGGNLTVRGTTTLAGAVASSALTDGQALTFGTSTDTSVRYSTAQTPDALVIGVSTDSESIIICQQADIATDFAHADAGQPTLYVQSSDAATPADYVSLYHNETDGHIATGAGDLHLEPNGADVAVTGRITVTDSIALSDGALIDQSANNKVSIEENSETLDFTFAADSVTIDMPTAGTDVITFTPAVTLSAVLTPSLGLILPQADLGATCSLGELKVDTAGTKELCYCAATNTWYCISLTTATGPTD